MKPNAAQRDVLPDLLKALLMFSVLLQHSATALKVGQHVGAGNWTNWLSASPFNMPLFMAICGYYFFHSAKRRTFPALMRSKLLMILVPCVAWIMLSKCVRHFLFGSPVSFLPWPDALWFLWSAMICMVLGSMCHYAFRRVEGWAMAAVCVALHLVPQDIYNVAYMFPFFSLGYMACKYDWASRFTPWMGMVAVAGYAVLHCFITGESSVWVSHSYLLGDMSWEGVCGQLLTNAYRFSIGFFGSVGFCHVVKVLHPLIAKAARKYRVPGWRLLKQWLLALGQYSLVVYASQALFLEHGTGKLFKILSAHGMYNPAAIPPPVFQWVCIPLTAFIISLVCLGALEGAKACRATRFLFVGKE
ncbi:MAG: acyltransferase family protein [Akkermansia sp.]|nr:acyltransferase family protein [Akkermansia sp.]